MDELRAALHDVADRIADYREELPRRQVVPEVGRREVRKLLPESLPDGPIPTRDRDRRARRRRGSRVDVLGGPALLRLRHRRLVGAGARRRSAHDRLGPVRLQRGLSPAAVAFEDVAGAWLKDAARAPGRRLVGFVTGRRAPTPSASPPPAGRSSTGTAGTSGGTGSTARRRVRVIAGAERHATIDRSLRLLGLGEASLVEVPATTQRRDGRRRARASILARLEPGPTIVCAQAGNVNTGACDDLVAVAEAARDGGRVGARRRRLRALGRGQPAAAAPRRRESSWPTRGPATGTSGSTSRTTRGYAFCAHPDVHATALAYTAAYLTGQVAGRELGGGDFVPESSRRARGFATWAALRALGRTGVADARRPLLRAGAALRRAARRARRRRGRQRRRAQPGARPRRRRRR